MDDKNVPQYIPQYTVGNLTLSNIVFHWLTSWFYETGTS